MIAIENLTKRFGLFTAVDNVSFSVPRGQVLGFLGPNGAGKSTTMRMIVGFLRPTSGTARIGGHDILKQPIKAKAMMGYMPEGAPSYPDMMPRAFLNFAATIRGMRGAEKEKAIDAAIAKLGLEPVLHQPIETLSKGFRRRVGVAQAILHNPPVLILDEPTDGLDPNQKHQVRTLIREMASEKAIIISTHILEEVNAVCDRAIIIDHGKLVADGTPSALEARSKFHNAVTISVPADSASEVERVLKGLPQVARVETGHKLDGLQDYLLFPKDGTPIVTEVGDLARERGWRVEELYAERGRLDEVFRNLTIGDAVAMDRREKGKRART
ncbi:MAG: ABC transporter ATP-binding protein [Alphaproteobacteria bacterium]